jgi:hypothetical protein
MVRSGLAPLVTRRTKTAIHDGTRAFQISISKFQSALPASVSRLASLSAGEAIRLRDVFKLTANA